MSGARIRFGPFELDPDAGVLRRGGRPCVLQSQPLRLLTLLVERRGELVTREQIREHLWPDTIVAFDQSINYAIRQIRIALGPDAGLLQTIPRRGYQFIAYPLQLSETHDNSSNRSQWSDVWLDMRLTLRTLARTPGLTFAIVGTLTVALAFTIASFGLLNGLLRHPYPYPKLQQLLLVRDAAPREGAHQGHAIAVADLLDARRMAPAFSSLGGWRSQPAVISSAGVEPERIEAVVATANFFSMLGVAPMSGRLFPPDADTAGHDDVVVLSRRFWNSRFGADPSAIGRAISVNGRRVTVIGIIRDEDCYPSGIDAWMPMVIAPAEITDRATRRVAAVGRLADNATESEARGQLVSLARQLADAYPNTNRGRGFDLMPLRQEQFEFTAPLFLFVQAAVALVVLLAGVNVSNLLIARTLDRRRELAVRAMLGAGAARIAGVAIGEVLALTGAAAVCAALVAPGLLNAVRASLPEGIARWFAGWSSLHVDAMSLSLGAGVAVLIAVVISAAVAFASVSSTGSEAAGVRMTRRSTWSRRLLVGGEVSLAVSLLLAASVMVTGFMRISAAFETLAPSRLLRFTLTLPESQYPDDQRIASFHRAMLDRLHDVPEIEIAALIRNEPASNVPNPIVAFQKEGDPALQASDVPRADVEVVSPTAFATLHLEVLDGRSLADSDGADGPRVAVVSRTAARRFWDGRNPVGAKIRLGSDPRSVQIVGVISDFALNWYDPEMRPVIFLPDAQSPARTTSVVLRTRTDPMSVARRVRTAVADLDPRQPLSGVEPLSTAIADSLSPVRIIERLLLAAAALAAALAALGIYGVLAHWVGARKRELGVRFALGATRSSIARMVLHEALWAAGAGIIVGLAAAVGAVRAAGSALLGVPSLDVRATVLVAIGAVVLTIAAALGPARRAARVDVAELLRLE